LSKNLVSDRFKFTHVSPSALANKEIRSRDEVIITTGSEALVLADIEDSVLLLSFDDAMYPLSEGNIGNFYRMFRIIMDTQIRECKSITIGIDPGFKHTGMSLFINGTFIEATIVPTSESKIKDFISTAIATALQNFSGATIPLAKIRIGNGNSVETQKVLDIISSMDINPAFEVQIVDESNSNTDYFIQKSNFIKIGDHARAAINIALRDGETIEQLKEHGAFPKPAGDFSRKQLKNIQAESRTISGDSGITIDQKLATKVLLGKLTLQDAISLYKAGKNKLSQSDGTSEPESST